MEIKANNHKCFVSCLYRSPSHTDEEFRTFYDELELTLSNLNMESPFCSVVLGDFNSRCSKCCLELDTLCSLSGFSQLVK